MRQTSVLGSTMALAFAVAFTNPVGAFANPVPSPLIGSWTDQPGCGPGHRMIFAADSMTLVQNKGRLTVKVETSGSIDDRLEVRVVRAPARGPTQAGGPKVGDVIVIRREADQLVLLAEGSGDAVHDVAGAPKMHRCPAAKPR